MPSPAFLFDIGNVMIDFDLPRLLLDLAGGDRELADRLRADYNNDLVIGVETGRVTPEEFLARAIHPYKPGWTLDDLTDAWADIYTLNPNGRELFLAIKARGFPVYILSNLASFNMEGIRRRFPGFLEESTYNFYSYELGLHKPDPAIYRAVCERTGIPAGQWVFFDDHEPNVAAARTFGMRAVQYHADRINAIRTGIESFMVL